MLLALLLTLSAWAGVVVEPLFESGSGFFDAEFLTLPDGRVAIVHRPGAPVGAAWTLLPEADAWRAIPSPGGAIAAAEDGLHAIVAWPDPILGGRRWRLEGERWVALPPLPELPPAYGVQAVQVNADSSVEAWVSISGAVIHLTQDGAGWRQSTVNAANVWDDDGQVFVQTPTQVQGRRRWQAPKVSQGTLLSFDASPSGAPTFVGLDEGRLRLWTAGEAATVALPKSQYADRKACQKSVCTEVIVQHSAPWSGRLAFEDAGPVVPIVRSTTTAELTCQPMPMHPCDPAGPINTCPTEPSYDCDGRSSVVSELLLLRKRSGEWRLEPVPLPVNPLGVLDTAVIDGELQLLLQAGVSGQSRGLYLVRVDAEGAPRPVRGPSTAEAIPWSVDALITAGFIPGQGLNTYVPWPAWEEGGLRTGGDAHGAGWVDLVLPWIEGPARLAVSAEVSPWAQGCGQPELSARVNGHAHRLALGGEVLVLEDPFAQRVEEIDAPATGAHTWALAFWPEAVAVEVDGVEVHRRALVPKAETSASFSVGQRTSCGKPVGPEVLWTGVRVSPIEGE